jgi:hypothetical protein
LDSQPAGGPSLRTIFDRVAEACEKVAAHVDELHAHERAARQTVV